MSKRNKARSGGRLVVDALRGHGVDRIFCVPGESYLEVLDALYDVSNEVSLISARHEGGAGFMAEAYGKLTGQPGVCLVTRGPGACNASIAIHSAYQDSTPMVMVVGQVPRPFKGREMQQEVDLEAMFSPLAKWSTEIKTIDEIPDVMARAFHVARSGRPGPVVVALPVDVSVETSAVADVPPIAVAGVRPKADEMERLRDLLEGAERPLVMIGGRGWNRATRHGIAAFAEANDLPVCCAFRRHDIFDNAHPNFVGEVGNDPDPRLEKRVMEADLIIAVGTRLNSSTTQNFALIEAPRPKQTLVHVHQDAAVLGRVHETELAIHAAVAEFVAAALEMEPVDGGGWRAATAEARRDYQSSLIPPEYEGALDLGQVMVQLGELLTPDAIVTLDAGNFSGWPRQFLQYGGGRRILSPAAVGAMGYGVPAAVVAKIVAPDRMVVGCIGDGGWGMTGQELATAVQYGAAPVLIVFNNAMFGTIRVHQERRHPGRTIGTDLVNPGYAALARCHGAHGETVEETAQFKPAFERAVAAGKVAVIELRVDPEVASTRTTLTALSEAAHDGA
ncbi:MAG: thiamine pyrophosphate-binding protein [Rhodospirillales bacterium]|jgi:acetolactate synthase-1/2/3 large subunit|nr:thiamine pyrophosphate-binding protein [Rhodospirillales bacterium]MDP6882634.1 thiamine pyrophosphate-binding protein [Rhodospirillales bacterium]